MDFSDYEEDLRELKYRLKFWGVVFFAFTLFFLAVPASFSNPEPIVSVILRFIRETILPSSVQLIPGSPTAPIEIYLYSSLFLGLVCSSPVGFYQVYKFIEPAVGKLPTGIILGTTTLFLTGCAFGFFILMPFVWVGMLVFFPYAGVTTYLINAGDFYSMVLWTTLATGAVFTIPTWVYLAAKYLGFNSQVITSHRKYMWAFVFLFTMFVTPDSSLISNTILFLPLIGLFEASMWMAKRIRKRECNLDCCWDGLCECRDCSGCEPLVNEVNEVKT